MSDPHLTIARLERDYERLDAAYRQKHLECLTLDEQLAAERAKVALAADALQSFQPFYDNLRAVFAMRFPMCRDCADEFGTCPNRNDLPCKWPNFTETLAALQSADTLADIRREVARECAGIARAMLFAAPESKWESSCNDAFERVADAIRAKIEV